MFVVNLKKPLLQAWSIFNILLILEIPNFLHFLIHLLLFKVIMNYAKILKLPAYIV